MRPALFAALALTAAALAWGAAAPASAQDTALLRLAEPRTHAILRHAIAPGTGDPAGFTLGDCATQRNLDDRGRDQARAIGAAFRQAGVAVDRVLTSAWCRATETARLLDLGPVGAEPALNSFFADRASRDEQTEAVRRLLAGLPPSEPAVLVTHQVNITALTGVYPRSGEVVMLRVAEDGGIEIVGRFLAGE
ncbi:MAG: histidine phosphatase family protein [Kiloniellaceae bacterium]